MKKLFSILKDFFNFEDWKKTLRQTPSLALALIAVATVLMNILANKSIIELPWLLQDAGILVSWVGFLVGDLLVKHFGAKHVIRVNLTCLAVSLFISCILILVGLMPGTWSPCYNYSDPYVIETINVSINSIMSNVWYVILGSAFSLAVGLVVNSLSHEFILNKIEKKHGDKYWGFLTASAISSTVGQIIDNIVFASLIGAHFFGWTWLQVIVCSLTGATVELLAQIIFTPLTYKISQSWKRDNVGKLNQ